MGNQLRNVMYLTDRELGDIVCNAGEYPSGYVSDAIEEIDDREVAS